MYKSSFIKERSNIGRKSKKNIIIKYSYTKTNNQPINYNCNHCGADESECEITKECVVCSNCGVCQEASEFNFIHPSMPTIYKEDSCSDYIQESDKFILRHDVYQSEKYFLKKLYALFGVVTNTKMCDRVFEIMRKLDYQPPFSECLSVCRSHRLTIYSHYVYYVLNNSLGQHKKIFQTHIDVSYFLNRHIQFKNFCIDQMQSNTSARYVKNYNLQLYYFIRESCPEFERPLNFIWPHHYTKHASFNELFCRFRNDIKKPNLEDFLSVETHVL